jgi:hypothetical protein
MGETSMVPGSETTVSSAGEMKRVELAPRDGEKVQTSHTAKGGQTFPVRVSKGKDVVVLRLNTERLTQQKKNAEANESIRRRTRG